MRCAREIGFTLIELSIVLVIIGLLVGGVLVGRDLIEVAHARAAVKYIQEYDAAVNTFIVKFNCLPGDCDQAVAFGLGDPNGFGCNGNGNGFIETRSCGTSPPNSEMGNFFIHLGNANLIKFQKVSNGAVGALPFPLGMNSSVSLATTSDALSLGLGNDYSISYGISQPTNGACGNEECPSLTPNQAYALDTKMDDGLPTSGRIKAAGQYTDIPAGSVTVGPTNDSVSCANSDVTGNNAYNNLALSDPLCSLTIDLRL